MANYKYSFHEERGEFHGYVEDEMGNTIYEMHYPEYYEDDVTGELIESSNIFEDGFMKSTDDTEGLKKYLVSMKLMDDDDELLSEKEFEESYMGGGQTGAYGHGTTLLAKGDIVSETKKELSKNFELPYEIAIYVPSTESGNVIINKGQFQKRIDEVRTYLADLFGGFSSGEIEGGYVSDNKGLIREDIVRVVSFAPKDGFKDKFKQLQDQVKVWCREWGQESMGVEFEGDLFYVSANSKFSDGGDTTEEELEEEESEENKEEEYVEELSEETDIPTDVLYEYASDRGIDIMDLTASDIEDNYIGSYSSREDFGERMVNEGIVGDLSNYLEMYDRDKEMFADEEAESRLDGMDEDDLVREANLEDEYEEVKERLERIDELTDEIEEIQSRMQELREQETETEEEAEEVSNEMSDLDSALEEKKTELDNLEDEDNDLESIIDRAREDARDNIYQEILDELNRDAVGYFTDNLGYDVSDLANHSLFTIDYDSIADDFEHDNLFIESDDGDLYVFRNYKWGGKLEHGGSVEQGNFRMLLNQAKELKHHAEELEQVLRKRPRVDAWVVALSERASLALSDITHYLDGTIHDDKASDSDVLNINVPTYIRTLEYAREDAKSDVDLHKLTENALEVNEKEGVVEMDDYEEIVPKMARGGELSESQIENEIKNYKLNTPQGLKKYKNVLSNDKRSLSIFLKDPNRYKDEIELVNETINNQEQVLKYLQKKFASGGEMPSPLSWAKLKVGQVYEWTIGAEPLQVKYVGKTKDNPNKKAGSSIGKGFLFEWVDEPNKYVEVGLTSIPRVLANMGTFARGGVNLGASFEKMKGQMKEEEKEKNKDLFETPDKIPAKVQEVLDAFADGIESGEYDVLQKAQEAVEAIGYTFDYDLDGTMSDLRKMGEPKSYARGGAIEWSNDENEQLGNWLMKTKDGKAILESSKNSIELEKNVRAYVKKHGEVAGLEIDNEDEGLEWVTFDDLMREIKSRYAKGGETTFQDKVDAIAKNLEGKKVAKSVQKDYGKRYSKKEALDSARRIVGSMKAKGMFK